MAGDTTTGTGTGTEPVTGTGTGTEAGRYLAATRYVDSDAPEVAAFVARALAGLGPDADATARAVALFEAVRDGLRYDPYTVSGDPAAYRASAVAGTTSAFCVPKAILLAAGLRAAGIPAALGFADVRNHLNTPRLSALMGTDLFVYHGYVQLWLEGRSFKVTPAFNRALCERFGVRPLVFDGTADALFHEYDTADRRHMEYVRDRGLFVDFPAEEMLACFRQTYPRLMALAGADAGKGAAGLDDGFASRG
jgi:transglutaminase-like putative cysteine protease